MNRERRTGMVRMAVAALTVVALLLSCSTAMAVLGQPQRSGSPEPVGLIVQFSAERSISLKGGVAMAQATGMADVDQINQRFDIREMTAIKRVATEVSKKRDQQHPLQRTFALSGAKGTDWQAMKQAYEALPSVERVELDYPVIFLDSPNDPLYGSQWHLNNTGQLTPRVVRFSGPNNDTLAYVAGLSGADMNVDSLFNDPPDQTSTVVVAVLDSGVDVDHPDLADNIWINSRDNNENGIDDDHNGYIDDMYGWNFASSITTLAENEPFDELGHGTHVAGIIAATTKNGMGIGGICLPAKIMTLRVEFTSDILAALVYAADNGADVANMSFSVLFETSMLKDAIDYAHNRGVVLCAATGNDGKNTIVYPAGYSNVIAVGASNDSDLVAYFSNFGSHIDVVAPGQSILSLRGSNTDMYGAHDEPGVHIIDSLYYLASGTSMSTPATAGVAAWIRAVTPGMKPPVVKEIIEQSAEDYLDPLGSGETLIGWDVFSGHGRVDAFRAVQEVPEVRAILEYPPAFEILGGLMFFQGTADGGTPFPGWTLDYGAGNEPAAWTTIAQSSSSVTDGILTTWTAPVNATGLHTFRLRVGADHEVRRSIYLATGSTAEITSPSAQDTVRSEVDIIGSVFSHLSFTYSVLEYRRLDDLSETYYPIDTITVPKFDEVIGTWSLVGLDTGYYWVRVRVDDAGTDPADSVLIYIDEWETWSTDLGALASITANYGDFDNDDSLELAIGTRETIRFLNANGTPKTEGVPLIPRGDWRIPIAVGNFDGDGIDDFAGVNFDSLAVYIFSSSGGMIKKPADAVYGNVDNLVFRADQNLMSTLIAIDVDSDGIDEIYCLSNPASGIGRVSLPQEADESPVVSARTVTGLEGYDGHHGILSADVWNGASTETFLYTSSDSPQMSYLEQIDLDNPQPAVATYYISDTSIVECVGMTAADIDGDMEAELVVTIRESHIGFTLLAFDSGLTLVPGFPRMIDEVAWDLRMDPPVFADIDGDCELEYFIVYLDPQDSHILAYNADGTPYAASQPLASLADEWINMLIVSDADGDYSPDFIAITNESFANAAFGPWFTAVRAWNSLGQPIQGLSTTLTTEPNDLTRHTPMMTDLDKDGNLDLVLPYMTGPSTSSLTTLRLLGASFDPDRAPVPQWRVNRSLTNISKPIGGDCPTFLCGDVDNNGTVGDYDDVMYLSNCLFYGGPPPPIPDAADVNASGSISMTDLTLLVNYYNGQQVTLTCPGSGGSGKTVAYPSRPVEIIAKQVGNETAIEVVSPVALKAIQVELNADGKRTVTLPEQSPLTLLDGQRSGTRNVGLIDMSGATGISAGQSVLVTVDGKVEIVSAQAVTVDYLEIDAAVKTNGSGETLPTEYALNQNYPNPFNPTTQISFALPEATAVTLDVYNALGQRVSRLADGTLEPGIHTVEWNAQNYSSGVYFYRLKAGDITKTRRMLLVK